MLSLPSHPRLSHCRRVFLRNYEVQVNIGVHEFEGKGEQYILANIELCVPLEHSSSMEDKLHEVVNYDFMHGTVARRMTQGHIHLQETLCDDVLTAMFRHPHMLTTWVSTEKPDVYLDYESVRVEVFRIKGQT